jgi:DNA-binding SARP family transcriptional activator/tetratricopeptide (TPR) repeat protein
LYSIVMNARGALVEAGPVQFLMLGPLEVLVNGDRLRLGNSREQRVLATLLLDANRVVPLPRLIEALWDEPPPETAAKAIRNCVSALRRRLAASGGPAGLIVTEPAGYLLRLGHHRVDLRDFERLVEEGRRSAAAGSLADAARRLREGLALWRGTALAGVTGRLIEAAAAHLGERRLCVQEECLAYELELGRDHQLVDELSALVAAQPLRERAAGELMVALDRGGRRGEALAVYQRIRRALVDELGIEPGAELAGIQRAILDGDPPATRLPAPAVRTSAAVPAQLPPEIGVFAGRAAELRELDESLRRARQAATMAILSVSGTAGVGKTTLAVRWARRVADQFPDGLLYLNLRGFGAADRPTSPVEALRDFLDAYGVPPARIPAGAEARTALYRTLLAGRRVLVLLDNARDAEQVRPLLPASPGCLVLVTSRRQLTGLVVAEGAHPVTLDLMSVQDAHELLARRLGPARVAAEPAATEQIIAGCGRLPLALSIVAARAAGRPRFPLRALAGELGAAGGLDPFTGDDPATDVRSVFSWSYRQLSSGAAQLFRLLGLHPGPHVVTPAAASLAGVPVDRVARPLAELVAAHLVTEPEPGRYAFHDLLRAYAAELAGEYDSDGERRSAIHRLLDFTVHSAAGADQALDPHRDPVVLGPLGPGTAAPAEVGDEQAALAWFAAEHSVLASTVDVAASAGFHTHACQLADAVADFLDRGGHWHDWVRTQSVALDAAGALDDRSRQARAHRQLGLAWARLGRYDDARVHLRSALDLDGALGARTSQASTHRALGWMFAVQGRYREALGHAEQALALHQAVGDRARQGRALNAIGWYSAQLGDYPRALRYCQDALDLHRQLGNRYGEAEAWDSLGFINHHLGHHRQSVTCYRRSLGRYEQLGARYYQADTLTHLGDAYHAAGNLSAARGAWQHAVARLDEIGHPDADKVRARLGSFDLTPAGVDEAWTVRG